MNKPNHACLICGEEYYACDSCLEVKSFTPWRVITDTQQHYQIYFTIKSYQEKLINKAEAREELTNIGVTAEEAQSYKEGVKNLVLDILKEDKAPVKNAPSKSKPNKFTVTKDEPDED